MSRFIRCFAMFVLCAITIGAIGCAKQEGGGSGGRKRKNEPAWISRFKDDLSPKPPYKFLDGRNIQSKSDVLKISGCLVALPEKVKSEAPFSMDFVDELQTCRDHLQDALGNPETHRDGVIERHLVRVENIYAVAAVLPAYEAKLALAAIGHPVGSEIEKELADFSELVQGGQVLDTHQKDVPTLAGAFELLPDTQSKALTMADSIATEILSAIEAVKGLAEAQSKSAVLESDAKAIALLNLKVAATVYKVTPEDPIKIWNDLKLVYRQMDETLAQAQVLGGLRAIAVKSTDEGQKKELETKLASVKAELLPKLEALPSQRQTEAAEFSRIVDVTDQQYKAIEEITQ